MGCPAASLLPGCWQGRRRRCARAHWEGEGRGRRDGSVDQAGELLLFQVSRVLRGTEQIGDWTCVYP